MTEEQLAATLAAVVTPKRLWREINAQRQVRQWPWWKVAVALDTSEAPLRGMRDGHASPALRARAVAWLERSRK